MPTQADVQALKAKQTAELKELRKLVRTENRMEIIERTKAAIAIAVGAIMNDAEAQSNRICSRLTVKALTVKGQRQFTVTVHLVKSSKATVGENSQLPSVTDVFNAPSTDAPTTIEPGTLVVDASIFGDSAKEQQEGMAMVNAMQNDSPGQKKARKKS